MTPTNTEWTDTIIILEYHDSALCARVIFQIKLDIINPHVLYMWIHMC